MTARLAALLVFLPVAALVGVASVGAAQTRPAGPSPSDLYHQGARLFVDGDDESALAAVESGLARAPDDARLQALRDLILKDQEENDQQDENQDPQDGGGEQNQDQSGEQEPQDGDSGDGEQDQRPPEAERDGTAQQPPQSSNQGQARPQDAGAPDQMTEAQAQRLLDAVGGEERLLLREMQRSTGQRRRSDKDW